MMSDFFRSLQPSRLSRRLAKAASQNKRAAFLIGLAVIVFLYLLFDNKGIITRARLESQRADLHAKVTADTAETARLRAQIRQLEGDKKTIERIAREKYSMARPGETVYRVKKDEAARGH